MADVTFGGLGENQPALNIEVEYGAVGRPVFEIGQAQTPGAQFLLDPTQNVGAERELGAPLPPIFPSPATEVRQNGTQQLDPNDNRLTQVELIPSIGSTFPGVAVTRPDIVPDPNDSRNVIVETFPGGVSFPSTEVKFITGTVLNFNP